jgi:hypothetical protein
MGDTTAMPIEVNKKINNFKLNSSAAMFIENEK